MVAAVFLPGAFGLGYFLPDLFASAGPLEMGTLATSLALIFYLPTALSGGLLLHPAEIDFVAVAPVSVRRFALADLLFQATVYGLGLPLAIAAAIGYGVRTNAPTWAALAPIGALAAFGATAILTVQALGIARSLGRRWAAPLTLALIAILLAPAILRFALRLPAGYAAYPLPTTAAVDLALLPYGLGSWAGLPVLLAFLGAAAVANLAMTARGSVPNLRATFAFAALFEPGLQRQLQAEAMLRAFGRLRRREGARLYRPTILRTMARTHTVRMTRDGTLFMMILLSSVFAVLLVGAPKGVSIGGGYVVVVIPVAAVAQWMQTDRANLWLVAVSGQRPGTFYQGWFLTLGAATAILGAVLALLGSVVAGAPDPLGPLAIAGGGLGAASLAVVCAARFPYVPSQLSVRALIHFLLAGVGAGIGSLPIAAATFALGRVSSAAAIAGGFAGLVAVALLSYHLVGAGAAHPEL